MYWFYWSPKVCCQETKIGTSVTQEKDLCDRLMDGKWNWYRVSCCNQGHMANTMHCVMQENLTKSFSVSVCSLLHIVQFRHLTCHHVFSNNHSLLPLNYLINRYNWVQCGKKKGLGGHCSLFCLTGFLSNLLIFFSRHKWHGVYHVLQHCAEKHTAENNIGTQYWKHCLHEKDRLGMVMIIVHSGLFTASPSQTVHYHPKSHLCEPQIQQLISHLFASLSGRLLHAAILLFLSLIL